MKYRKSLVLGFVLAFAVVLASPALAQDRVGFEENFDTADGWKVKYGAPIKSLVANGNGTVTFSTVLGTLSFRGKLKNWKYQKPSTGMYKEYKKTVDFNKFHYLVINMPERGTMCKMYFCAWVPVLYTSGLRVFDMHDLDIRGKKEIKITVEFLNNHNSVTFDYFRLVSELTEEEKKGLIQPAADFYKEKLSVPPYHNLEAMNARAGRCRLAEGEGQLLVFEDAATRGEVWRLTDQPGDQSFSGGDNRRGWTKDGRYYEITRGRGGKNVWDHEKGGWRETLGAGKLSDKPLPKYYRKWASTLHPNILYGLKMDWSTRPNFDFKFFKYDKVTGREEPLCSYKYNRDKGGRWAVIEHRVGENDKVVIGLRETPHTWIIDPEAKEEKDRVKYIKLPSPLKGLHFSRDDKYFTWSNCYTYENWHMEIATGKLELGTKICWSSHSGGGFGWRLGEYANDVVLKYPSGLTTKTPGDEVKFMAYYKSPFRGDYGRLVDNGDWWLVNGNGGDVAKQHLMVNVNDCATILRLVGYNTSRNSWSTNTYTMASPDTTKVAWMSDQLGDGDIYYVVARKPDPVQGFRVKKMAGDVRLAWDKPDRCLETAGYVIYGAGRDEKFTQLNKELIKGTNWSGKVPAGTTRFMVAAREWGGLEGFLSPVVRLPEDKAPGTLHLDVWLGKRSKTARVVFDGRANGTRCVRNFRASKLEKELATVTWNKIDIPPGDVKYFMRQRADLPGASWQWAEATVAAKKNSLALALPEGMLIDKVIVSTVPDYKPQAADDRFALPGPVTDAKAEIGRDGKITLNWNASAALNFSRVEIFAGADENFTCNNTTAVGAVPAVSAQKFVDWAQRPGTTVVYKLIAVDSRGKRGRPTIVKAAIPAVGKLVYAEMDFSEAKAGDKLQEVKRAGEDMITAKPTKYAKKPNLKDFAHLEFSFEVPADGNYNVWVHYAPGYTARLKVLSSVDGKGRGNWTVRAPYKQMYGPKKGKDKIFKDKIFVDKFGIDGKDRFALSKGTHKLTLYLDPSVENGEVHAVSRIWVTNDPSFRPKGYDPRADFAKLGLK